MALKYNESNLDSALYYSHLALSYSSKTYNKKLQADSYFSLGVTFKNLIEKFPSITQNERKRCTFLRLNLSTKDISTVTMQTVRSIE